MDIFTLAAKLRMDTGEYESGLRKAERKGKDFGNKLEKTFGRITKAAKVLVSGVAVKKGIDLMAQFAGSVASVGDQIDKQSQALGMSRKAYQEWDYILSQTGGDIESMGVSMKTLNSAILSGSKDTESALKSLGLSSKELKNLSQEDAFERVVRAFQKMPAGAQKSALAVKMFGRNGQELLPLLNSDIYEIDMLRLKAQELGLVMSDEAVDASVKYTDALDTMQRTFNGLKYSIGSKVLPVLTNAMTNITNYAAKIRRAYEKNGIKGVFQMLVADIKKIKWPTWNDIKNAIETGWNTIVKGVKGLAKIVFGENVDGSIKWPTWSEISGAVATEWKRIVDGVSNLGKNIGKVVFGTNVDGTIKWPTWPEIVGAVSSAWQDIVNGVKNLGKNIGKAVFGTNVDGTIKWPTWSEIGTKIQSAWDTIIHNVKLLPDLIFGENSFISDSLNNAFSFLQDVGNWIIEHSEEVSQGLIAILGAITVEKLLGLAAVNPMLTAIATAALLVVSNWDLIKDKVNEIKGSLEDFMRFLEPINNWFLQLQGGGNGALIQGQIADLQGDYRKVKAIEKARGEKAGQEAFENYVSNFARNLREAGIDAEIVEKAMSQIDLSWTVEQMDEYINSFSDASAAVRLLNQDIDSTYESAKSAEKEVSKVGEALDDLPENTDVNINVNYSLRGRPRNITGTGSMETGNPWWDEPADDISLYEIDAKGQAKGDWSVPYDNYLSMLHRGEMVLTASQARRYRDGEGGNTSAIIAAIQGLRNDMQNLRLQVNGRDFGRATVRYGGGRMDGYIGEAESRLAAGYGS